MPLGQRPRLDGGDAAVVVRGAWNSARGANSSAHARNEGVSRAVWVGVDSFHDKRRAERSASGPNDSAREPTWCVRGAKSSACDCARVAFALFRGVSHSQLSGPFQALAPEDEQGFGVVRELKGFGSAVVGESGEGSLRRVGGAQDHGAGVVTCPLAAMPASG